MTAAATIATSTTTRKPARRLGRVLAATTAAAVVAGLAGALATGSGTANAAAKRTKTCAAAPTSCGYPGPSNTGVRAGTRLKSVPGQVSSGPGWSWDSRGWVNVTGDGAVLSGLAIHGNVNITANNVTLQDDQITVGGQNAVAVSVRGVTGTVITKSTISGLNSGTGRMMAGVKGFNGAPVTVLQNNISLFESGVQIEAGLIQNNYIHDPGFITGDHTNGVTSNGGDTDPLTITHNTILVNRGQTDAVGLFEDFGVQANRTVTGNLLAGGAYTIYGGQNTGGPATYNMVFTGNEVSTIYFPKGGNYGPVAYLNRTGTGSQWARNTWDPTGQLIP